MSDDVMLEEIDRDEAVAEASAGLAEAGGTRRSVFRRFGLVAGGGLVAGVVPFALAGAQGGLSKSDVKILNFALTLEYLEAAFYAEANRKGKLKGAVATFSQVVGQHEAEHVTALKGILGSQAVKSPEFDFKGTTGSEKSFLSTAKSLEDTGVSAYQGQADRIDSVDVLASAGSILAVEARHASWVRNLIANGKTPKPAPDAFSPPLSMKKVLDVVDGTGFIKS